jgi:hypothetical protein
MDDAARGRMALTAAAGGAAPGAPGASQAGPYDGRNPLATLNPTQLQAALGADAKGGGGGAAGAGATQRGPRLGGAELEMQDAAMARLLQAMPVFEAFWQGRLIPGACVPRCGGGACGLPSSGCLSLALPWTRCKWIGPQALTPPAARPARPSCQPALHRRGARQAPRRGPRCAARRGVRPHQVGEGAGLSLRAEVAGQLEGVRPHGSPSLGLPACIPPLDTLTLHTRPAGARCSSAPGGA